MYENYPKTRPALPEEIRRIYAEQYRSNRQGGTTAASLSQRMEGWMHRMVARDAVKTDGTAKVTLELGAGTLNQLQYEPSSGAYDIVEPFRSLFEDSPELPRIRNCYADVSEIPEAIRYDRITSVAVLEHVCNLPEVVAQCGLMLENQGAFHASVPSEGTILWTLGWKLTTGLEFRLKHGLDYGLLMKHEHVNTAAEIESVLRHFFKTVRCRVFGLNRAFSLYRYYECHSPNLDRCREFSQRQS